MDIETKANWIDDGEKYALVGLHVNTEGELPEGKIAPGLWVLSKSRFAFPEEWKEWLGTIRAEDVESCNLFLMSKLRSETPDVLDGENQQLRRLVHHFFAGLVLSCMFATAHKPVILSGSRRNGEIGIREVADLEAPVPREFRPYPGLTAPEIKTGARLGLKIIELENTSIEGGRWRFFHVLQLYQQTRSERDLLERIHQYARCIDGLILPDKGNTTQQFKSRTELFIGPKHHPLMGDIYEVRSAVEHLHINCYLEEFNREVRLALLQKEAIIEHIARKAIARIVENPALWPHFANTASLAKFWQLEVGDRRRIWGEPIDPLLALEEFEPKYISDSMLGKRS